MRPRTALNRGQAHAVRRFRRAVGLGAIVLSGCCLLAGGPAWAASLSEVMASMTARLAPGQTVPTVAPEPLHAAARSLTVERAATDPDSVAMLGTMASRARVDLAGREAVVNGVRSALNEMVENNRLDPALRNTLMARTAANAGMAGGQSTAVPMLPDPPLPVIGQQPTSPAPSYIAPPAPDPAPAPAPAPSEVPDGFPFRYPMSYPGQPSPYPTPPGYAPPYVQQPASPGYPVQTAPQPQYVQPQPQYPQPQYAQPQYAQPQPQYVQPQPQYAQPQPQYAQPQYAQPQYQQGQQPPTVLWIGPPGSASPAPGPNRIDPSVMDLPEILSAPPVVVAKSGF